MLIYIKITKHLSRKYHHEMQNRPLGDQAIPLPSGPTVFSAAEPAKIDEVIVVSNQTEERRKMLRVDKDL